MCINYFLLFFTSCNCREEQERLRGYFRLSTKRLQKSRSKESGASSSSGCGYTNARKIGARGSCYHKDEYKNTTPARASFETHNEANAYLCTEAENKLKKQHKHYGNCDNRNRKDYLRHATQTVDAQKDKHVVDKFDKADVKIKIISENRSRGSSIVSEATSERKKNNNPTMQKLTLEAFDNNSFSNMTASTYCNGNSSLLDDGGLSNFGDGEDSSIVSGMIVNSANYNAANYSRRPSVLARQKDETVSDVSSLTRLNSTTTLERDLEIMSMLEQKRNSDGACMEREERHTERRRLPDIDKICQRLPKMNLFDSSTDTSLTAALASTGSARDPAQMLSTATVSGNNDPLTTDEAYSSATASNSPLSFSEGGPMVTDEEVPQDFFDDFKPGGNVEGPKYPVEASQYQYTRRHSRHNKTPHFGVGGGGGPNMNSHRNSKRDSFNSLHGNDLIAGAFGELDPTQPLTKMSVIESRMRRSSGRSSSFTSNTRSSMRSRDLTSTHTMHPELDFRENIFAEL